MAKEAEEAKVKFFNDYFLLIFGGRFFWPKSFAQTMVSFIPTSGSFFFFLDFRIFAFLDFRLAAGGRRR